MRKLDIYKLMCHFITKNKILVGLSALLFLVNAFYLSNPHVNNSGDFASQSHLLIIVGMIFSFLLSNFAVISMDSQMNTSFFEGYGITLRKVYTLFIFALISFFVVFHTIICLILCLYYAFLFGPEVSIVLHTLVLYINYFFLSLFVPFMLGIYIALNTNKLGYIYRYGVPLLITIIFAIMVSNFNFFQEILNIFTINGKRYYNPFSGIANYTHTFITKILLLLFIICIVFLKVKLLSTKKKILIYTPLMIVTVFALGIVTTYYYHVDSESFYTESYIKEYEKNVGKTEVLSEVQNFIIESYDIEIIDNITPVFKVDVAIKNIKNQHINLYLNETFKVSEIKSNSKKVPFTQKQNKIKIELKNTNDQVLTFIYQSEKGTALNPITKESLFLPYFFNWLPSQDNTRDYSIYNNNSVEYNSHPEKCSGNKSIISDFKDMIVLNSTGNNCLSIVKGDFIEKKINSDKTTIYLPKVWSGNIGSFEKYSNYIDAEINLFNEIFNEEYSISYENIIFIPKYDAYSQPKFHDIWFQENYQIILMNPFLNINEQDLFTNLISKAPFNLSYSLLRDVITSENQEEIETFSLLFTIYFFEKTNLQHEKGYLNYFISINKKQEVVDFLKLDTNQMEKQLILKYQSFKKGV
ncbi:hypothetical protein LAV72_18260 [Lysinibacillus xylanilyticus]|uniref:hypothetical protein n=1 Tax=Lysinibacillus xylanilyticus TaxID=582475 RepID=UPI002B2526D8|nr:hypothetical protein [Lysinibacillus xylanilyticus]MEB2301550.1 hypothetical protein [Lysinibacillus xylanilyticus]